MKNLEKLFDFQNDGSCFHRCSCGRVEVHRFPLELNEAEHRLETLENLLPIFTSAISCMSIRCGTDTPNKGSHRCWVCNVVDSIDEEIGKIL